MGRIARTLLFLGLAALAAGCGTRHPESIDLDAFPPPSESEGIGYYQSLLVSDIHHYPPPDREAVLAALRKSGVLTPKAKEVSMRWDKKSQKWHVIVVHAKGLRTYWETDSTGREYTGGTHKPSWFDENHTK